MWAAGIVAYLLIGGLLWGFTTEDENDLDLVWGLVMALLWPIVMAGALGYAIKGGKR